MISLKTISEKLNARRRYREAISELSKLSDHELSDIGICRCEICEALEERARARQRMRLSQRC